VCSLLCAENVHSVSPYANLRTQSYILINNTCFYNVMFQASVNRHRRQVASLSVDHSCCHIIITSHLSDAIGHDAYVNGVQSVEDAAASWCGLFFPSNLQTSSSSWWIGWMDDPLVYWPNVLVLVIIIVYF